MRKLLILLCALLLVGCSKLTESTEDTTIESTTRKIYTTTTPVQTTETKPEETIESSEFYSENDPRGSLPAACTTVYESTETTEETETAVESDITESSKITGQNLDERGVSIIKETQSHFTWEDMNKLAKDDLEWIEFDESEFPLVLEYTRQPLVMSEHPLESKSIHSFYYNPLLAFPDILRGYVLGVPQRTSIDYDVDEVKELGPGVLRFYLYNIDTKEGKFQEVPVVWVDTYEPEVKQDVIPKEFTHGAVLLTFGVTDEITGFYSFDGYTDSVEDMRMHSYRILKVTQLSDTEYLLNLAIKDLTGIMYKDYIYKVDPVNGVKIQEGG